MKGLSLLQRLTLLIILIAGTIFRFYNYASWSLSNDELSALNRLQYNTFSEVIEKGVKLNDMHPPGVQSFLYIWTSLFGISEKILRLPFVIFGILSMYLLFLVAKNWFNTNIALIITAAFTALTFPILYSQLARPYSPGLMFSLLVVYYWTKLLFPPGKTNMNPGYYIGFILSGVACMYTHYFAFLFVAIVGLLGIPFTKDKSRILYIVSGVIMFLFLLPFYSVYEYQLGIGGLGGSGGWLGPPKANAILQLLSFIFNDSIILISTYFILFIIILIYFFRHQDKNIFRRISALLFFTPYLIAYFYSILKNPVYQHSIMLFSFPYLLLFIFGYLPINISEKKAIVLTFFILAITGISTVGEKNIYSTQYFGVFKELAQKTIAYQDKYGKTNVAAVANVILPYYINYYHNKYNNTPAYILYNTSTASQLEKLNELAKNSTSPYLSYVWSNTANPEEVEQIVTQYYPIVAERINYFNSGVRLFAKPETKENGKYLIPAYKNLMDFERVCNGCDSLMYSTNQKHTGSKSVYYNPAMEFGPTFKGKLNDLNFSENCVIWLKVWVYCDQVSVNASLVLQVDEDGKTVLWRGADIKDYVLIPNSWQPVFLAYKFTEQLSPDALLSAYVWNSGKSNFYIDDLSVTIIP